MGAAGIEAFPGTPGALLNTWAFIRKFSHGGTEGREGTEEIKSEELKMKR